MKMQEIESRECAGVWKFNKMQGIDRGNAPQRGTESVRRHRESCGARMADAEGSLAAAAGVPDSGISWCRAVWGFAGLVVMANFLDSQNSESGRFGKLV